jgi:hypothetical protein
LFPLKATYNQAVVSFKVVRVKQCSQRRDIDKPFRIQPAAYAASAFKKLAGISAFLRPAIA